MPRILVQVAALAAALPVHAAATLIVPSRASASDPFVVSTIAAAEPLWIGDASTGMAVLSSTQPGGSVY